MAYSIEDIKTFQKAFLSEHSPSESLPAWIAFSIGGESFLLSASDILFISPYRDFQELHFLESCYSGYTYFDGRFYSVADLSAYLNVANKTFRSNYLIYLKDSSLALMAQGIDSFAVKNIDDGGDSRFPFCHGRSLYLTEDGIAVADLINSQKIKELI